MSRDINNKRETYKSKYNEKNGTCNACYYLRYGPSCEDGKYKWKCIEPNADCINIKSIGICVPRCPGKKNIKTHEGLFPF